MAKSKSGRIVIEIDPSIKRMLYLALEQDQITLKDWFLGSARLFIKKNISQEKSDRIFVAEHGIQYKKKVKR